MRPITKIYNLRFEITDDGDKLFKGVVYDHPVFDDGTDVFIPMAVHFDSTDQILTTIAGTKYQVKSMNKEVEDFLQNL